MRFCLTLFICLVSLTGCVNYFGSKPHSSAYNAASLAQHHHYPVPRKTLTCAQGNWWEKFKDPQLNHLIEIALADSPNFQIAQSRLYRAQRIADAAVSPLLPSSDLSGVVTREHYTANWIIPPPFGGITASYGNLSLNFHYELDFWGKNRQALAARISEIRAAEADLAASRLIISTAVASAYFQLQTNRVLLQIDNAILKQRKELQTIVSTRLAHNLISGIPHNQANVDTQSAELAVARAKEAVQISRHQLAVLMGKNPLNTTINLPRYVYHENHLRLPPVIPANLLGRRPDIVASRWRVEAAAHQVNVAKARCFPNINLSGFLSYQALGLGRLFAPSSKDNNIQGAFDLPIFDAGLRHANVDTRYAEYDTAVNQYNQTLLTALRDVADQLSILAAVKSQQTAQSHVLKNTLQNYKLTQSRYHHGITDYSQVLQLKGVLLNQQQIEIQLQAQRILTVVAMIKALGGDYYTTAKGPA
ncbi:MAG: efflux transporter outer membrane subunit [Gammaproteobacteria bacterium]